MRGLHFIGMALLATTAVDAFGYMSIEKTTCRRHALPQQVDSFGACGCGCQGGWAVPVVGLDHSNLPTLYTYEDNSGVFNQVGHNGGCSCGGSGGGFSCGGHTGGVSCGGNGGGCSCGRQAGGCACGGNGGGCSCGHQAGGCACGGNGGVCTCGAKDSSLCTCSAKKDSGICTCGAKKEGGICTCGAKKEGGICTCGAKKDDEICACGAKKNGGVCTCGKKKEADGPKQKHKDDIPVKDIAAEGISAFFKVVHGGIKMVEHLADKINKDKCACGPKKVCKCDGGGCAPGCGCRCCC